MSRITEEDIALELYEDSVKKPSVLHGIWAFLDGKDLAFYWAARGP
jgi:hypothetical protein